MYCSRCGQKIPNDALFCEHCGNRICEPPKPPKTENSQKLCAKYKPHKLAKSRVIALCLGLVLLCTLGVGGSFWFLRSDKNDDSKISDVPVESTQDEENAAGPVGSDKDTTEIIQTSIAEIFEVASSFTDENGYVPTESVADAIDAVYNMAREKPGIVSSEKDEYGVYIAVEAGLDYVYMPEIEGLDSGDSMLDIITMQPYYTENRTSNPNYDHDGLDTCANDVSASDTRWHFQSENNVNDDDVTLERILNLDDFKMILWHGHGGYTKKSGYYLCTTIDVTTDLLQKYPCLNRSNAVIDLGGKLGLKASFFQDNYPENAFENAFIYLATCLSGKNRELADILIEKGAAVVFVNSDTIQRGYNLDMLHLIVESFCLGGKGAVSQNAMSQLGAGYSFNSSENWSISDSLSLAKRVYGERDHGWIGAEVFYVGKNGVDRLTYTEWMNKFDEQSEPADVPLVVDAWSGNAVYVCSDEHGNKVQRTTTYSIPKFTLSSEEIETINNEIMNTLSQAIEDSAREFTDISSLPRFESISYIWAVHNDIVSLMITVPSLTIDWVDYYVYNVSITEKKAVSKEELVFAAGLSMQEYNQLVKQALGSEFWDRAGPALSESTLPQDAYSTYQRLLQNTISDDNISQAKPFFNENGQLCAVGAYGVFAGGGTAYAVVNLEEFILSPYYADEIEMPENNTVVSTKCITNVRTAAYLRSTPEDSDDNIICTIPLGTLVGFIETANPDFSRIMYDGEYGYVKTEYLGESDMTSGSWSDGAHTVVLDDLYQTSGETLQSNVRGLARLCYTPQMAESLVVGDVISLWSGSLQINSIEQVSWGYTINDVCGLEYDASEDVYLVFTPKGYDYSPLEHGILTWDKAAVIELPGNMILRENPVNPNTFLSDYFSSAEDQYVMEITTKNNIVVSAKVLQMMNVSPD